MYRVVLTVPLFVIACIFTISSTVNAQLARPNCLYGSSDVDGDGFGFENGATCIVTDSSLGNEPQSDECIDDNADGWGWNGSESCQVSIEPTSCIDTDPVGDGWGWDGVTSCRVVPSDSTFDEIEEIRNHFGVVATEVELLGENKAAVVDCSAGVFIPAATYYLKYSGRLAVGNGALGIWSTGLSTSDGRILLYIHNLANGTSGTDTLYISRDKVSADQAGTIECQWRDRQGT